MEKIELIDVIKVVKDVCGVDITNKIRSAEYFHARQIYYAIAKKYLHCGPTKIALGVNCTHATVINAIKKWENDINIWNNRYNYEKCLELLGLKETITLEENKETRKSIKRLLMDLNRLSDEDISEFEETRLKPYIKLLESRNKPKIITHVRGALLNKQK